MAESLQCIIYNKHLLIYKKWALVMYWVLVQIFPLKWDLNTKETQQLELNLGELWLFKPDCSDMAAFKISRRNCSVTVATFNFQSRDQRFEKFVIIVNTFELYFWEFWLFISDCFYFDQIKVFLPLPSDFMTFTTCRIYKTQTS